MTHCAWYGLQVIFCSGIMTIYYCLLLRNKRFHKYNRFYILGALFLSFLIPLIKIRLEAQDAESGIVQLVYIVGGYNTGMDAAVAAKSFHWNWSLLLSIIYIIVSAGLLFGFIRSLVRIYRLLQKYPCQRMGNIFLVQAPVAGTPFSFFKYIFWNNEIDYQTGSGQQILRHEVAHIKEKHSIDVVIVQLILAIGWMNPFFWLAKKELYMIHEFTADNQSVQDGDAASFAAMLLTAAYPTRQHLLTHSFFFSPIKRRLFMLTNNKTPRYSYARRIIALPLMAVITVLFAFRAAHHQKGGLPDISGGLFSSHMPDTIILRDTAGVSKNKDNKIVVIGYKTGNKDTLPRSLKKDTLQVSIRRSASDLLSAMSQSADSQPLVVLDKKNITRQEMESLNITDISSINVLKGEAATAEYGDKGKNGVIVIRSKQLSALFFIDGKETSDKSVNDVRPEEIESIHVWKGDSAVAKFGERGRNGVIEVTRKKN